MNRRDIGGGTGRKRCRSLTALTGFLAALAAVVPVLADSDGYYCAGSDYLAFEVREWNAGTHLLRVVALTNPPSMETFELPPFQVHGLLCDQRTVDLLAWTEVVSVNTAVKGQAAVERAELPSPGHRPSRFSPLPPNLGAYSEPANRRVPGSGTVDLPGGFELTIEVRDHEDKCTLEVLTRLTRANGSGDGTLIYRSDFGTECG